MAKKVLVVDDAPNVVQVLRTRLQSRGYEVVTALDGKTAIEKAKEERPDLVLLDLLMPQPDGYAVLTDLKRDLRTRHIPIIIVSVQTVDPASLERVLELGADDNIVKPYVAAELIEKVEHALHER